MTEMANSNPNDVTVTLEFTPNPETLKYAVNRSLLSRGAANFTSLETAKVGSPLATAIFEVPVVSAVMVGTDFVTVTLKSQDHLMDNNNAISNIIRRFLLSGDPAVTLSETTSSTPRTEIEEKIIEILDRDIRPAVAMDGGDITFEKYDAGFVYLKMQGACSGCPSSLMTLKMGVETRLREAIPEIQEVIPV